MARVLAEGAEGAAGEAAGRRGEANLLASWRDVLEKTPALKELEELQRAAQWRLDMVAAENSMGFHAPQASPAALLAHAGGRRRLARPRSSIRCVAPDRPLDRELAFRHLPLRIEDLHIHNYDGPDTAMIFGASATHALRALSYLAANGGGDAVLGRELARRGDVPSPYLTKVLATLAAAGVVTATRGARGGYRLARPADMIRLREIVEPFEGGRAEPGCLLRPQEECREDGACPAHRAWSAVQAAYGAFLEETTLADIQGGVSPDSPRHRAPARPHTRHRSSITKRRTTR